MPLVAVGEGSAVDVDRVPARGYVADAEGQRPLAVHAGVEPGGADPQATAANRNEPSARTLEGAINDPFYHASLPA